MINKIKKTLNDAMTKLKKENPNASWGNLLTGVAILLLVAIFSFWYFNQPTTNPSLEDGESLMDKVEKKVDEVANKVDTAVNGGEGTGEQTATNTTEGTVTVQKGEGLWQVALRVCGDAEKYNKIADQNGLSHWELLNEGMTLNVSCE